MRRSVHYRSTLDRTFFALGILEEVDLVVTAKVGHVENQDAGR